MASESKKRKGKNSYLIDGGEKIEEGRLKRIFYFNKAQRNKLKKLLKKELFNLERENNV